MKNDALLLVGCGARADFGITPESDAQAKRWDRFDLIRSLKVLDPCVPTTLTFCLSGCYARLGTLLCSCFAQSHSSVSNPSF